jgi:hypothetical protein
LVTVFFGVTAQAVSSDGSIAAKRLNDLMGD